MKYTYIVIEDEKGSYLNLKTSLNNHKNYLELATATNVSGGLKLIYEHQPDLIFLDVELGSQQGFELIEQLKSSLYQLPAIIMTTAHNHYAKQAVNNNVLYFVSKPIDDLELQKALLVFEKQFANTHNQLIVKTSAGVELIPFESILYLRADKGYSIIVQSNGRETMVSKSLKFFEDQLPNSFLRVHKSYIVNQTYITHLNTTKEKIYLAKENNGKVVVSLGRKKIPLLKHHLKF